MILVSGATGRIGSQVVRTLRRLSLDVRALVRKGSEYFWLNDSGCRYFFGDLRDPASLARAIVGARYLVCCATVGRESRDNHHENVTVGGLQHLVDAARQVGVERVVLVSCLGVGHGFSNVVFEARQRAEDILSGSGLPFTILRTGLHEGPFLDLAFRVKEAGSVLLPGPGKNLISPLACQDVARMAAASLDLASVKDQIVEVGGATMSAHQAFEAACLAVGVPPTGRVLPEPAVSFGSRLGRPLRRWSNRLAEMAVWWNQDLTVDAVASAGRFGLKLTPLDVALAAGAERMAKLRDPEQREAMVVHRQFYATIYEPGTARLEDLPEGPPRR